MNFRNPILDIIFPRHCLGCDILLGNECQSYVCRPCLKSIPFAHGFACAFCKSPVKAGKTCVYCVKNHYLDRLLVATSYENPLVEKIIKTAKYRFVRSLADDMADLMIKYLKKKARWLTDIETLRVVPVPLHRRRLNWRGFNQAEIIGGKIGQFFRWPVIINALQRHHNRKPQADMPNRASRIQNAQNLFQLGPIYADRKSIDLTYRSLASIDYAQIEWGRKNGVAGKTILLIDDISTTGSTLNDCARVLKGAGAREVIGFVFARGKFDGKNQKLV